MLFVFCSVVFVRSLYALDRGGRFRCALSIYRRFRLHLPLNTGTLTAGPDAGRHFQTRCCCCCCLFFALTRTLLTHDVTH
uniref:Putative secreted protein n=1 Tax=Anopheles darlingi TaxID=43151 RepID=A0A2M4DIR2_ANODA